MLFLDTSFAYALINKSDEWHEEAVKLQKEVSNNKIKLITSEYILWEIANGLSAVNFKKKAGILIKILMDNAYIKLIPSSSSLLKEGLNLYEQYSDKDFSLTDSISFIIMNRFNVKSVLSSDHHFEQMGFETLMKKEK